MTKKKAKLNKGGGLKIIYVNYLAGKSLYMSMCYSWTHPNDKTITITYSGFERKE